MNRFQAMGVGAHVWADWLGDGGEPVTVDLVTARVLACNQGDHGKRCPHNRRGNLWDRLTGSAVVRVMEQRRLKFGLGLKVQGEDKLGHCQICHCPLDTKVWVPMKHIEENTPQAEWSELPAWCWMRKEAGR